MHCEDSDSQWISGVCMQKSQNQSAMKCEYQARTLINPNVNETKLEWD